MILFYLSLAVLLTAAFSLTSCGQKTPAVTDATPSPTGSTVPDTTHPPTADIGAPAAPQNLVASKVTATSITLTWEDLSGNEDGFQLYCEDAVIMLAAGTTFYEDTGLKPAAEYVYQVKARNSQGLSAPATCTAKTLNPSLKVVLDRIGVRDNGESGVRDLFGTGNGEVQVGLVVSDGKKTVKLVLPDQGYYELKEDGTVDIGSVVFQTDEVGDYLRIMATAYENDGGLGEQVLYEALEYAVKQYFKSRDSFLQYVVPGLDLSEIMGGLFGQESDWLGTYSAEWLPSDNWGTGTYADVECPIGDGKIGLRLWFRVE
jgi:hypothetical protein